jgi:hypothetical protein
MIELSLAMAFSVAGSPYGLHISGGGYRDKNTSFKRDLL